MSTTYVCAECEVSFCERCDPPDTCEVCSKDPLCPSCAIEHTEGHSAEGEPQEGDLATGDHQRFYMNGKLVLEIEPDDDMWLEIERWCKENNYWPDVWFISDHGNVHKLTREI